MPDIPRRFQAAAAVRELVRSGEARRLRLAAGIPAAVMAAGLGISRHTLSNLETGHNAPGPLLAARWARVLRGLANHDEVSRELAREGRSAA